MLIRLPATVETTTVGYFDAALPPALSVDDGDIVDMETLTHWRGRIDPDTSLEDVVALRKSTPKGQGCHTITGPVEIRGAEPGDVLRVEVVSLDITSHGFNLAYPGTFRTGLLWDDFPDGSLRHFDQDPQHLTTQFATGVQLALRPFLGIIGVAPHVDGPQCSIPPGPFGGNMDFRDLVAGSCLYLPVFRRGAMFYIGDAHSLQGNGEVCLTAIETAMPHAVFRFTVMKGWSLRRPMAETEGRWATLAFDVDLREAARTATRDMITFLSQRLALRHEEAYGLASVAMDLHVTQVVNQVSGVHATVSKSLFAG